LIVPSITTLSITGKHQTTPEIGFGFLINQNKSPEKRPTEETFKVKEKFSFNEATSPFFGPK
jgi:hypothetical protein